MESIIVPEGGTATFTVALWKDPDETVEVEITYVSGDADITVDSEAHLVFDSSNYFLAQPVTLRAAEDEDFFIGNTLFRIEAEGMFPVGVTAIEEENEPVPEILYVDGSSSTPGPHYGRSWTDALTKITEALQIASEYSAVEEIRVAQGVYTPTDPNGDREVSFQLVSGVSLLGGYGGLTALDPNDRNWDEYPTILSGDLNGNDPIDLVLEDLLDDPRRADNSYHVVTFTEDDAATFLEGFAITGGNANREDHNWRGGGMRNSYGNPTVKHCRFFANAALNGGAGVYNQFGGTIAMDSCSFDNNYAGGSGGGIYISSSTLQAIDCTFHRNSAQWGGGGVYYWGHSSTFENCTFRNNSAYWGGGLNNYSLFDITLNGCVFSGNTAGYSGGGMYNDNRSKTLLHHCIYSGNSAQMDGGGIYAEGRYVELTLNHCTLVANRADHFAGGMFNEECEPLLSNSIFWGNIDQEGAIESSQIYKLNSSNPEINYCCVQGWTGNLEGVGNMGCDPNFVDLGYWDPNATPQDTSDDFWVEGNCHLKSQAGRWEPNSQSWVKDSVTSLCIDTGNPASDWSAELWPHGGRVNMGVYGGTAEASMSLSQTGNIADLNLDGKVDILDYDRLTDWWRKEKVLLKEDLSRNGKVDAVDLEILCENWLWEE